MRFHVLALSSAPVVSTEGPPVDPETACKPAAEAVR